jgi:hypothetical protein
MRCATELYGDGAYGPVEARLTIALERSNLDVRPRKRHPRLDAGDRGAADSNPPMVDKDRISRNSANRSADLARRDHPFRRDVIIETASSVIGAKRRRSSHVVSSASVPCPCARKRGHLPKRTPTFGRPSSRIWVSSSSLRDTCHGSIGYVTPNDVLADRVAEIHERRDRKLTEAREKRAERRATERSAA